MRRWEALNMNDSHNDASGLIAAAVAAALILEGYFFTQTINSKDQQIQTLQQQVTQSEARFQGFVEGRR
jgi:outer membrane murein-binding lipoprotein Lpp